MSSCRQAALVLLASEDLAHRNNAQAGIVSSSAATITGGSRRRRHREATSVTRFVNAWIEEKVTELEAKAERQR